MRLFDSHCHLQDERLAGDLEGVMQRAREAGVARFCCCGSSPSDWSAVEQCSARFQGVVPAFGLHPWYLADGPTDWMERLRSLLLDHPEAPLGEIGLDHAIETDRAAQAEVFRLQMELALDLDRPVSVHIRKAWGALLETLDNLPHLPPAVIVHAYSGGAELVPALAERNVFFSFSGSLTRPGNRRGTAAAVAVPADRLLLESDAPDLAPVQAPAGRPNEPAFLRHTAETLARLRGLTLEETAALTWTNACRALRLAP